MKPFFTAIALTLTLFLIQSCSSSSKLTSAASDVANASSHEGHNGSHSHISASGGNHHGSYSEHLESDVGNAIATLRVPSKITPNTSIPLVIEVQDRNGKAIPNFERFQEQLIHLIIVSDDLQNFNHIYPIYKGNGRFEVQANFPSPGGYTLFSDYKPAGKAEQVSVLKAQVPGQSPAPSKIDPTTTKTLGDTKASLKLSQTTLKAGQEVHLIFNLQDAVTNQPLNDLQPYLGERGHLVILKQSLPLTKNDYIHAHALKDTLVGEVHFITRFPQPGNYKLWGQFNRNGKIVTADFWVNVE